MKASKSSFAHKFHHGFVWACMGLTGLTALCIALKGWEYVLYVRPVRKAEETKIEQELLMEGQGFTNSASEQLPA